MIDAPLVLLTDELPEGTNKINQGIQNANSALKRSIKSESDSTVAVNTAIYAKEKVDSVQKQLDTIVVEGDSSLAADQARVDEKGYIHSSLKDRIDYIPQQIPNLVKKVIKVGETESIAHRGLSGIAPENTMISFKLAESYGFDSWECDVHVSNDSIPVVIHDDTVDRTTNGTGNVRDMTIAQLKLLDASKTKPYFSKVTIPTFEEWLIAARGISKYIYPEIKGYRTQNDISILVDLIVKYGWEHATTIQSVNSTDLTFVRGINKNITLGYLIFSESQYESMLDIAASDGNAIMLPDYNIVLNNPSLVKMSRDRGIDVAVWTPDSSNSIRKLREIGVTRYMSNRVWEVI